MAERKAKAVRLRNGDYCILSALVVRRDFGVLMRYDRAYLSWWDWALLCAFCIGHVQQLKAQRKYERGDGRCDHCEGGYADTIHHLMFSCMKFADEREVMLCELLSKMGLPRRIWHRMPPDKRMYEMLFPCRERWAAGRLKDDVKERLKTKRRGIIHVFLRFLKQIGRFEDW